LKKNKSNKVALITGITGQDGAYLAEFLLKKGYTVHGIKRRSSSLNTDRIDHLYVDPHVEGARLFLHYGDLTDSMNITRIIQETQPDEIYNLGAMSHVKVSFETPEYTANTDGLGLLRILEAVRLLGLVQKTKIYQASTSELYGKVQEIPQTEKTPFYPRSPYGVAKLYAFWTAVNYREAYQMFACNGILFNHESPLRGETFLPRKVSRAVAALAFGKEKVLYLGNLEAKRDWGHARDYVEAMWLMLQQDEPNDYVIATGKAHSVRELVELAFLQIGITVAWKGQEENEIGILSALDSRTYFAATGLTQIPASVKELEGKEIIRIDPEYFRPTEVDLLLGDASKAKKELGWSPKISFEMLITELVDSDLKRLKNEIK
jgi:GDPmannose 4,6-dehydratase